MALELEWYDLVCFGIVGVTFLGTLWVLWMHEEASKSELGSLDETLLVGGQDNGIVMSVVQRGRVIGWLSSTQLWSSCWPGMHPLWLLLSRFLSFVTLAVLLPLDVREYDFSIFIYYTEYVVFFPF
ncbi:unnamed protein product [Sphenostylis stenocarpa]|uniref:Uncharacterized protein n=1 Tax=Sphenostylis stenocarpa TaxID=92480 RepID=A0AA86VRD6_9FABA|nr:unnamed protein product [Sphenostylis stenocarpa]